tara:strand:- start:395 stop:835 length:441 start_codon:yes stop_codon:yes gene_type:complete
MPEGIGYGAIKKKKPQKRNRLRKLSPKEIEKEFQGKHKIENPPAKYKISSLSEEKEAAGIANTARRKHLRENSFNVGGDSERAKGFQARAGKRAGERAIKRVRKMNLDKLIRNTKKKDKEESKATKEKLKAERKKGNPDISKRTRK